MKKQNIFLFFLIILLNTVYSQHSKTGIIYFNHIDNHYGVSYNSYLVFNQNKSYFVTAKDSLGLSDKKNHNTDNENTLVEIADFDDISKTRKHGLQVYLNKTIDSIFFTNAFSLTSRILYVKEKRPELSWEFVNETKQISKFLCKKAITNFRGRKYICWYTEDIPLPYGPWKLQGLPGIILEAQSEDSFFKIIFKQIKYPEENIKVPTSENELLTKGKKFISLDTYKMIQKQHIKRTDNSLKIHAKKFGISIEPFSERDNFLEIFGF